MNLFKRKAKKTNTNALAPSITSYDKITYKVIGINSNEILFEVCDTFMNGHPVLLKFEKLDVENANKMLSFISGVLYAIDGKIFKVENRLFLIGRKEDFEDGTLQQYIEDSKC